MTGPKSHHQSVTEWGLEPMSLISSVLPMFHDNPELVIKSSCTLSCDFNFQWDSQDITDHQTSTWTPNSYIQCLSYIHHKVRRPKTELLIFFSNICFVRSFQMCKPKYYSYPWLLTFPHTCDSIHHYTLLALLLKHIRISVIKYWWKKKISRIWPTAFHHIYCHHHSASHQTLLDYYKNHLPALPASIFAPRA